MSNFFLDICGDFQSVFLFLDRVFSMVLFRKVFFSIFDILVFKDFFQNDDEKERLQRRRFRVIDLQFNVDSFYFLVFFFQQVSVLGCFFGVVILMWVVWVWYFYYILWVLGLDFEKLVSWIFFRVFCFCFLFRNIDVLVMIFKFTNIQIVEYYFTCIKLFIENVSICWCISEDFII